MKSVTVKKIDGPGDCNAKQNKLDTDRQILHVFSHYVETKQRKKKGLTI